MINVTHHSKHTTIFVTFLFLLFSGSDFLAVSNYHARRGRRQHERERRLLAIGRQPHSWNRIDERGLGSLHVAPRRTLARRRPHTGLPRHR
jgi:hypothetical protein